MDVVECPLLPLREALGGVDAQDINTGIQQGRDPLHVVTGVDSRPYYIAVVFVQQLQGMLLVGGVVLAEHHGNQVSVSRYNRKGIELVLPDQVVGLAEGNAVLSHNEVVEFGHVVRHRRLGVHLVDAEVTAGDDSQQLAVGAAIGSDCHGGVAGALLQVDDILQGVVRLDVGV